MFFASSIDTKFDIVDASTRIHSNSEDYPGHTDDEGGCIVLLVVMPMKMKATTTTTFCFRDPMSGSHLAFLQFFN